MTKAWFDLAGWLLASFAAGAVGALALADIVLLAVLVAATIFFFARAHELAAALLLPYLGWVTYAAALMYEIWRANGERLSH